MYCRGFCTSSGRGVKGSRSRCWEASEEFAAVNWARRRLALLGQEGKWMDSEVFKRENQKVFMAVGFGERGIKSAKDDP